MKEIKKQRKIIFKFPDGSTMIPGPGNVPTTHVGASAKVFSKVLAKAAKAVSDAGIFDSEKDLYGNGFSTTK